MVAIDDIEDWNSLKAWLREAEVRRQDIVALTIRAAARTLPIEWWNEEARFHVPLVTCLRAMLVSTVVGLRPRQLSPGIASGYDLRAASKTAEQAAEPFADQAVIGGAAWAAIASTVLKIYPNEAAADAAARETPLPTINIDAIAAAASGVATASSAVLKHSKIGRFESIEETAWSALRFDCYRLAAGDDLGSLPLFPIAPPEWYSQAFAEIRKTATDEWSFWLDWYQRLLDGREQNWPLLLEIATQDDIFWRGSDDEVNARIAEIVERYAQPAAHQSLDSSQLEAFKAYFENGDRIVLNEESRLTREPVSDVSPTELATIVQRVTDTIKYLRSASGFGNSARSLGECLDFSDFLIGRRPDFTVDVHNALKRSGKMFDGYIAQGSLPDNDPRIVDFLSLLAESGLELERRDSHVQKRMRLLGSAQPVNLPEGDAQDYREQVEVLAGVSTLEFAEEQRHAARIATDPNAEDEDRKEAQYKSFGWLLRLWDNAWEYADKLCIKVQTLEKIGLLLKRLYDLWKKLDPDGGPTC